jgi:hypothetical protein
MHRFSRILSVAAVAAGLVYAFSTAPIQASPTPLVLRGGAESMDGLLRDFVQALESGNRDALERLRVTEREYRELVVPGNVAEGDPPQILSEEASEYFWQVLDQKSRYYRQSLLEKFGGETFSVRDVTFEKGYQEYAGHRAWKQLVLSVADASGEERQIRTGSIIERDGRFKFVSFVRD